MTRYSFLICALTILPAASALADHVVLPSVAVTGKQATTTADLASPSPAASRLNIAPLDSPVSTTQLDQQVIDQRNNRTVQDAVTRSPGISSIGTPGNGNTALSARGFAGHGSVMTLFDGSRLYTGAGTQSFPVDPFMVEGIDIIRGPASVLYGEGATGAVINVIPKKPFEGAIRHQLRLGYGSYDRHQLALDSGGSLHNDLSYRFTLNRQGSRGWVDQGDSERLSFSAALQWQATDELSFTLAHDRGDSEPMNYFGTPLIDGRLHDSLKDKNYNVRDARQRYEDRWTRLTTDWSLSDSVTAANQLYHVDTQRRWRNAETYDWDSARGQLLRGGYLEIAHDQEQIGTRQTFSIDHALFGLNSRTLVGVEYNRIRFKVDNNSPYQDVGGDFIDPFNPAPGTYISSSPYRPLSDSTTNTAALFAENHLKLSPRWSLVTGIRRDRNGIERIDLRADTRADNTLRGGNWRAGLVFAVNDNTSFYGQYSTSEDGVSNLITLNPTQLQMTLAEARQTEFGVKQQLLDGRGHWTLAAYHIIKDNLLTMDPLTRQAQQIGQQSSEGLELSLALALAHGWRLDANAAWVRAEFDTFNQTLAGELVSLRGNRPEQVPRRTGNLWMTKALGADLEAGLGARYVGSRYADNANSSELPGYTVVDANVDWGVARDVRLGLQLNNLLDRRYAASRYNGGQQWILGEPRSFFVTADYHF